MTRVLVDSNVVLEFLRTEPDTESGELGLRRFNEARSLKIAAHHGAVDLAITSHIVGEILLGTREKHRDSTYKALVEVATVLTSDAKSAALAAKAFGGKWTPNQKHQVKADLLIVGTAARWGVHNICSYDKGMLRAARRLGAEYRTGGPLDFAPEMYRQGVLEFAASLVGADVI